MGISQRLNKIEKLLKGNNDGAYYKMAEDGNVIEILRGVERRMTQAEYIEKREAEMKAGVTIYSSLDCYFDLDSIPLLERYKYVTSYKSNVKLEDFLMNLDKG